MKSNFQFDKKTGTMVPFNDAVTQGIKANVHNEVVQSKSDKTTSQPKFQQEKKVDVKADTIQINQNRVVQMKRITHPSPIQLVDKNGLPESYLDSVTTGVMMFREQEDYDICQIADERTGKVLAYISGYALQFNFNMAELNTMERIEQCLQGLVKLFRHQIMHQNLHSGTPQK